MGKNIDATDNAQPEQTDVTVTRISSVLLPPEVATQSVSRQELVNVMVVEYLDRIRPLVDAANAALEDCKKRFNEACILFYRQWKNLLDRRYRPAAREWLNVVARLTERDDYVDVVSSAWFGNDPAIENGHLEDVSYRWRSNSEDVHLTGALNFALRPKLAYMVGKHASDGMHRVGIYWSIVDSEGRNMSIFVHTFADLTIPVELKSEFEALCRIRDEFDAAQNEVFRLSNLEREEDIKRLERRALAKLTKASLAAAESSASGLPFQLPTL
jgi:hypothetical protein